VLYSLECFWHASSLLWAACGAEENRTCPDSACGRPEGMHRPAHTGHLHLQLERQQERVADLRSLHGHPESDSHQT
jgi:hypothetical protein